METFIKYFLLIHAVFGGVALISGPFAMFSKKGQKLHLKSGRLYFWSMLIVVITGVVVGLLRNNLFIQTIAVFSFYMVFTGRRLLRFKKEVNPQTIDWIFNISALLVALGMIAYATLIVMQIGLKSAAILLYSFGAILFNMAARDFLKLKRKRFVKNQWLFDHISRMGGSYIATFTAFLVVNIQINPVWVVWLFPTFIGTPMIIFSIRKWSYKLNPKAKSPQ